MSTLALYLAALEVYDAQIQACVDACDDALAGRGLDDAREDAAAVAAFKAIDMGAPERVRCDYATTTHGKRTPMEEARFTRAHKREFQLHRERRELWFAMAPDEELQEERALTALEMRMEGGL